MSSLLFPSPFGRLLLRPSSSSTIVLRLRECLSVPTVVQTSLRAYVVSFRAHERPEADLECSCHSQVAADDPPSPPLGHGPRDRGFEYQDLQDDDDLLVSQPSLVPPALSRALITLLRSVPSPAPSPLLPTPFQAHKPILLRRRLFLVASKAPFSVSGWEEGVSLSEEGREGAAGGQASELNKDPQDRSGHLISRAYPHRPSEYLSELLIVLRAEPNRSSSSFLSSSINPVRARSPDFFPQFGGPSPSNGLPRRNEMPGGDLMDIVRLCRSFLAVRASSCSTLCASRLSPR